MQLTWLQAPLEQLWQLRVHDKLHHALLFTGVAGVGKGWLVQQLVQRLLCQRPEQAPCGQCKSCLLLASGHHPDFLALQVDSSIGVDTIRQVSSFFQQSSQQGGAKIVAIPAAHKMTEAAANALLKTLEEPGQQCYLLLQTDHPQRLLPTILSRCQAWPIATPSRAQSQQFLLEHTAQSLPAFLLELCSGAPLRVLELWREGQVPLLMDGRDLLLQLLISPTGAATKVAKLEQLPLLAELIRLVVLERFSVANDHQFAVLERYNQWNRDCALILGQNKTIALAALVADLAKYTR